MKIEAMFDEYNLPVIHITNGNRELTIDISQTTKRSLKPERMYEHINEYLNGLERVDLNRYFRNAVQIDKELSSKEFGPEEVKELKEKVAIGVRSLQWNKFLEWFREAYKGVFSKVIGENLPPLPIPDTVHDKFEYHPDKGDTADKTYITSDLVDLVALVLFCRAMMPYYNDYLTYMLQSNNQPYTKVFELFIGTEIDTPEGPLAKLREYVGVNYDSIHGKGGDKHHRIIEYGISDDDVVDNLVARSIFEKLLMLDFFYGSSNPISQVYQTVSYGGRFRRSDGANIILKSSKSDGDENEYAIFENYRKQTDISPGMLEVLRFAHSDDRAIVQGLGVNPDEFDWGMYESELTNMKTFMENEIEPMKLYLLAWLLKDVVGGRAVFTLENRRAIELLLLCKVFLLSKGQNFVATVFSSIHDEEASFVNSGVTVKNTLSKALSEQLGEHFKNTLIDKVPTCDIPIIEFGKLLTNMTWKVLGYADPNFTNKDGYLNTPNNVTDLLVEYVTFTVTLNKK